MENRERYAHIPGWGADLSPTDRPAYPKERIPARLPGLHWNEPELQVETVEILRSNERDGKLTPIFGSSVPPKGMSGMVRRLAFKFSENDLRHWLLLQAADRTNVVEGVVSDLSRGRVPNIPAEMGFKAAWKHDRTGVIKKAAIGAAVVGFLILARRHAKRS